MRVTNRISSNVFWMVALPASIESPQLIAMRLSLMSSASSSRFARRREVPAVPLPCAMS